MAYSPPIRGRRTLKVAPRLLSQPMASPLDALLASQEIFSVLQRLKQIAADHEEELKKAKEHTIHLEMLRTTMAKGDPGTPGKSGADVDETKIERMVERLVPKAYARMPRPTKEVSFGGIAPTAEEVAEALMPSIIRLIPKAKGAPVIDKEAIKRAVLAEIPLPTGSDSVTVEDVIKTIKEVKHIAIDDIAGLRLFLRNLEYKVGSRPYLHGGGGSSSGFTVLAATGALDNSNTVFTFTTAPTVVVVNGVQYRNGHGVSIVGLTATLDNPAGTNGDVYGLA